MLEVHEGVPRDQEVDPRDRQVLQEVVAPEDDAAPDLVAESEPAVRLDEVPLAELGRQRLQLRLPVRREPRLGQRRLVDVRRVVLDALAVPVLAERLGEEDGRGVGLLARRAPRRPDADRRRFGLVLEDARDDVLLDELPCILVAEEAGDVDQDRVEKAGELVAVRVQVLAVLVERLHADGVHALQEATRQARPLVPRVVEAARVADVFEETLEGGISRICRHDRDGRTNSTSAGAIRSSARTWATAPLAIAAAGMPKNSEEASSWARTTPPASFNAAAPAAPSDPVPENTTARQSPA